MIKVWAIACTVWLEMLRKKDIYVLLILLAVLLVSLLSVDVFGLGGVSGYVQDMGLLFTWVFAWVLSVVVPARELPAEEKQGTIYTLLAKPLTRCELIAGKWLGSLSIVAIATLSFYCVIIGVTYLRGGRFRFDTFVQAYILHVGALAVISSLALALSTRMNFDAAATTTFGFTGAAFLIVPEVPRMLAVVEGWRNTALLIAYGVMPHFDLFDMRQRLVYDKLPARWSVVGLILLYAVLMTLTLLMCAWLSYANKRFRRGRAL